VRFPILRKAPKSIQSNLSDSVWSHCTLPAATLLFVPQSAGKTKQKKANTISERRLLGKQEFPERLTNVFERRLLER